MDSPQFISPQPATPIQNYPSPDDQQQLANVLNQYVQNKQQNSQPNLAQQILANRFRPSDADTANSITTNAQSFLAPNLFHPTTPEQTMAQRYQSELSPYTSMLENQMKAGTQYMNMSGGGTGVLVNRMMQDNPSMNFTQAFNQVQANPALLRLGLQMPTNSLTPTISAVPGAPMALGQVEQGKQSGQEAAKLQFAAPIASATTGAQEQQKQQYAGPIAQATKTGENIAENLQTRLSTGDIVGLYGQLKKDAQTTPSGAISSSIASLSNKMGAPTEGAKSQAQFDADLNNLYLATIRSLKGTGRVMEQELIKIGESAPNNNDSNEVKMIKAQAHMDYYTRRMQELGYDPTTGQPLNSQTGNIQPMNASQLNQLSGGGLPNPPSPDQIGSQGATHRYNPATGQLEQIQ